MLDTTEDSNEVTDAVGITATFLLEVPYMKSCGVSLVGLVLGIIVAGWLIFHVGDVFQILNGFLKMLKGG